MFNILIAIEFWPEILVHCRRTHANTVMALHAWTRERFLYKSNTTKKNGEMNKKTIPNMCIIVSTTRNVVNACYAIKNYINSNPSENTIIIIMFTRRPKKRVSGRREAAGRHVCVCRTRKSYVIAATSALTVTVNDQYCLYTAGDHDPGPRYRILGW